MDLEACGSYCGMRRKEDVLVPKVMVVDPDESARTQAAELFERAGYEVLAVGTGPEAIAAARSDGISAVILEIPLGDLSGYEVCRSLRTDLRADLPIIFVSGTRTEPFDRVAGLLLGADDYLVKPYAPDELLARVRRLVDPRPQLAATVRERLTKREREVLGCLVEGLTQQQIAQKLFITSKTVGSHIEHILAKLGVASRAQAVALAFRDELVALGPER